MGRTGGSDPDLNPIKLYVIKSPTTRTPTCVHFALSPCVHAEGLLFLGGGEGEDQNFGGKGYERGEGADRYYVQDRGVWRGKCHVADPTRRCD